MVLLPGVCTVEPFSLTEWELELTSGLVVICLPAEHPIILAHKGRVSRQDHPMVKRLEPWCFIYQQPIQDQITCKWRQILLCAANHYQ